MLGSSQPTALFVYYKGKVKCIGMSGHYGYYGGYEKGKLIGNCYKTYMGGDKIGDGYMLEYYKIKNGKLKIVAQFFDNSVFGNEETKKVNWYWVGGKRVSKKKFDKYVKKNTGSKNPKFISCADKFVTYK